MTEDKIGACVHCGAADGFWAWYDSPERQTITLLGVDDAGRVNYDYAGSTESGDVSGEDYAFMCGACGNYSESLEVLLGLPEVPGVSTLASLFAEGQKISELDSDDFSELVELVQEDAQRRGVTTQDARALDELAAYLRDTDQWNGGDFCELAARAIGETGREL